MKKIKIIYEMANNHMGDLDHGLLIIDKFKHISSQFDEFDFAFKLQYRDDSFFHPHHINRKDHKLIKRFTETRLGDSKFRKLVKYIKDNDFQFICTPWDEKAVKYLINLNVEIIKIASCSFNDWNLLEETVKYKKNIIASTAGATELEIDRVVSFLKNKKKNFSLMHCVGEYPTINKNLHLDQIDFLKNKYSNVEIGYSTHEEPKNIENIQIAIAKGATIFEKHVGVKSKRYDINKYSAEPEQVLKWLYSAKRAIEVCGGLKNERKQFSKKEKQDLRILYRGAYASKNLTKSTYLKNNYFLAMPNIKGQLVAKELGKFSNYKLKKNIKKNKPIMLKDLKLEYEIGNIMEKKFLIKDKIKDMINSANIILPKDMKVEISHHYGIDNFFKKGAVLFHIVNKEYSKILIMMFPGQKYPAHVHKIKNETYFVLSGDLKVNIGKNKKILYPGDRLNINKETIHSFETKKGVIFEEISTTYISGDSNYIDGSIPTDGRKTIIKLN